MVPVQFGKLAIYSCLTAGVSVTLLRPLWDARMSLEFIGPVLKRWNLHKDGNWQESQFQPTVIMCILLMIIQSVHIRMKLMGFVIVSEPL